ncbi:MAG: DNA-processing protein DprA [Gammaproteobacteria bacterium]|nr:DNA-processing protein DprA [Gammaproteobacteria bacterium]
MGELDQIFKKPSQLYAKGFSDVVVQQIQHIDWKKIETEIRWSEKKSHHIITFSDSNYPELLRQIASAPPVLFVSGDLSCLKQPQFAIVGSRKPTPVGREIAYEFARDLARAGFVITSGLALGIDGESHRGALESAKTIAVLGTSLDHIYPSKHHQLAQQIEQNGALVSEFSFSTPACPINFPRRNRIISGLSLGVLVVEATMYSGSLITAKLAMEQNRDVFAIPGSIRNPLSQGCHKLISEGAKLVKTVQDIIEEYDFLKQIPKQKGVLQQTKLESEEEKLLSYIGFEFTPIDTIIRRTGFSIQQLSSMLLLLELKGYIKSMHGGYYKI